MAEKYIAHAWEFIEEAKAEFKRGVEENNPILMRDACEKAWGAAIQAINSLFQKKGIRPFPKSHRDRRISLRELEAGDEEVRRKNLLDQFMAREYFFHQKALHEGDIVPAEVEAEFTRVEAFIKDVEDIPPSTAKT